jgi:chromosome segregation ATPase
MMNVRWSAPLVLVLTTACAEGHAPAASPAAAEDTSASGVAEPQADSAPPSRSKLEQRLAEIDAQLADIGRRLQVAQEKARAELQEQFAVLQQRDVELRARLRATSNEADESAARAQREIQRAIMGLDKDMKKLEHELTGSPPPGSP